MTSVEIPVMVLGTDLLAPDARIPLTVARVSQVAQMIVDALGNFAPGQSIDTAAVQAIVDQAITVNLSSTFTTIRWVGPSWPSRPTDSRPIMWLGGPSKPALGGSTAGGTGMAPIDYWVG